MTIEQWRDRSAEDWFARNLSDDLSNEEKDFFDQWFQDPVNAEDYRQTTAVWEQAKFAQAYFSPQTNEDQTEKEVDSTPTTVNLPRRRTWSAALAATITIGLFIGLMFNNSGPSTYSEQLITAVGQQQEYMLPDGSSIELGVNTSISAEFTKHSRELELISGEAYFKVAKDEERRFNLTTNGHVISVTGTEFNVRARSNLTQVLLVEGSVQIESDALTQSLQLKPGQKTEFGTDLAPGEPSAGNPNIAMAWRSGKAVFVDASLTEVIASFSDYHTQPVQLDPSLTDLRVSGVIPISDYNVALETLGALLPVEVEYLDTGYQIRAKR